MEPIYKNILVLVIFTIVLFLMSYIIPRHDKKIKEIEEKELNIKTKLSNRRDAFIRYKFCEQDLFRDTNTIKILESIPQNENTQKHIKKMIGDIRWIDESRLGYLHEIITGTAPTHEVEFKKWEAMNDLEIYSEFKDLSDKLTKAFFELRKRLGLLIDERRVEENTRWRILRLAVFYQLLGLLVLYLL